MKERKVTTLIGGMVSTCTYEGLRLAAYKHSYSNTTGSQRSSDPLGFAQLPQQPSAPRRSPPPKIWHSRASAHSTPRDSLRLSLALLWNLQTITGGEVPRGSAGWPTASLSLDLETHIKDVLKGLPASCTLKSSPPPAGFDKKKELRKYEAVHRALSQYGFTSHQVEQALLAIPLLPSLFTAGFRVKSFADEEVQVLHASGAQGASAAAPSSAASAGSAAEPEPSQAESPWASPAPSGQEQLAPPLAVTQEEEEQQAAAAAKAWTRQYMQQAAEEQGSGSESSSSQEMDDWELWADAREVERRRQARQRSRVPPEQRKLQLAVELRQCKQRAASAKASGDKAKQKEVGALIRGLRQEMEQLGFREAELEQLAPSQPCPAAGTAAVNSSPPSTGATGLTTPVPATTPGLTSAKAATPGNAEEEGVAGLLAGCGGTSASAPGGCTPACQQLADKPAKPGKAKASGPPGQAGKTPVALLSQQCQQRGWRQARYLNLACEAGQFCCSLELDMGVARGADRKKGWQGVKTFSLALGWRTLEDAKNAVAARALWELFGAELPLLHCLALTYRELWSRWDAETKAAAQAGQQQAQEAVQALVARVLEAKLSRAGTSSAAWTLPSDDDGGREGSRADYWEAAAPDQAPDFTPSVPASPRGQRMQAQREALPIVAVKEQLVQLLEERDVVLVCGDTGCGKTTQVPQYILEHATRQGQGGACNVVCTQPRRIAATSVAER
ncbi:DEAH-box RNA helicase [Haematococcus lacustris]|uniref:DEAH-box RNA helicase n=1 Tax=Haematococcus lacustris TaxID=44745 RepID=A0A699YRD9_HAELA|nr:DEAH-box RNA helicase [Haematococcus lacustris]